MADMDAVSEASKATSVVSWQGQGKMRFRHLSRDRCDGSVGREVSCTAHSKIQRPRRRKPWRDRRYGRGSVRCAARHFLFWSTLGMRRSVRGDSWTRNDGR
jgi:hypothetical protein